MASGFSALDEPTMTAMTSRVDDLRRGKLVAGHVSLGLGPEA